MRPIHLGRSELGLTLIEGLVALLITSIVAIGPLSTYAAMTSVHRRGELAAESQREVRTAFDTMLRELRYVGFDYDRDGDDTPYPNQTDEQVEFAGVSAITIMPEASVIMPAKPGTNRCSITLLHAALFSPRRRASSL